jgi:hypothetical protein
LKLITSIPATGGIITINYTGILLGYGTSTDVVGSMWLINKRTGEGSSGYSGGGSGNALYANIHVTAGDQVQIYYSNVKIDRLAIALFA